MSMPRGVEEILRHAELAARFEDDEPDPADESDRDVVAGSRAAVAERPDAERHVLEAARKARQAKVSWPAMPPGLGPASERRPRAGVRHGWL
jgi:hypothetical protein